MYIPAIFNSQQDSCITASVSLLTGSGSVSSGSYVSGGFEWKWIQITNTHTITGKNMQYLTASLNIEAGRTNQAKLLLIGGGGGGGSTNCYAFGNCGNLAGGGGGAGGVVYYNNFPLYSGSYTLYVGSGGHASDNADGYTVDQDHTQQWSASVGQDTIFVNRGNIYTPFTSSQLTAYGGGAGAQWFTIWSGGPGTQVRQDLITPDEGGSGGGAVRAAASLVNEFGASSNGIDLGGLNGRDQGNSGGSSLDGTFRPNNDAGCGGGGAGSNGVNVLNPGNNNDYATQGGSGSLFTIKGTAEYFAAGGGGCTNIGGTVYTGSAAPGDGTLGSGGRGGYSGWITTRLDAFNGQNGTIIVLYPSFCGSTYTVYRMQSCCDTASFSNVAVQSGVPFGLNYVIYNPNENKCMKSVAVVDTYDNVSFSLTTANFGTYSYGTDAYSGSVDCLNCRTDNGLAGCLPITNTCQTWTFRYNANLPNPPSTVSFVNCDTGLTSSFTLSPANRNGSACVRSGTTPTVGANITIQSGPGAYCGVY